MKTIYEAEKSLSGMIFPKPFKKIVKLERELQDWRDFCNDDPDFTKSLQNRLTS